MSKDPSAGRRIVLAAAEASKRTSLAASLGALLGVALTVMLAVVPAPANAAEDWAAIEKAAKAEGPVVVYTTLTPENWAIILKAFNARYPDVKVTPQRTGQNAETFERYRAESASGTRTADVLMATGPDLWVSLAKRGEIIPFEPESIKELPDFASYAGGYYTLSMDPQLMIYNKLLLTEAQRPTGFKDLVAKAKQSPSIYNGRIGSYNPRVSPYSYTVFTALLQHHGDAFWPLIADLAPMLRFDQTAGVMIEKVQTGEYVVAFMLPSALLPQHMSAAQQRVLGIAPLRDGTPMITRDMGVMKSGSSHNGGKLLANFLLSRDGQIAIGKAGLTPYYPGIEKEVRSHYATMAPAGVPIKEGVAYFTYSDKVEADMAPFRARFNDLVNKKK